MEASLQDLISLAVDATQKLLELALPLISTLEDPKSRKFCLSLAAELLLLNYRLDELIISCGVTKEQISTLLRYFERLYIVSPYILAGHINGRYDLYCIVTAGI